MLTLGAPGPSGEASGVSVFQQACCPVFGVSHFRAFVYRRRIFPSSP
jgi:hypothetical protein